MSGHKITVERHDEPAASFYMQAAPWVKDAACLRSDPKIFFDNIEDELREGEKRKAIIIAQNICAHCPVRIECGEEAMRAELNSSADYRCGFRAYMTKEQRASIARRGGLKGRDPMRLVKGWDGKRRVPPVPVDGDKWTRHHTTLARRLVRWLVEHVEIGADLPAQSEMCSTLKCQPEPLRRVLQALVQDGTLDFAGRVGRGANASNQRYTRRGQPRRVGSWLPLHLRNTDEGGPCGD